MWHFRPPPIEKLVPKTVQWNIIIIIINIIIIIIIIAVVVIFVDDDTYYWVYLSSDRPFQVYFKVRQVLLQRATVLSLCSLFEPREQPGTKKFSTLVVNPIKLLQG